MFVRKSNIETMSFRFPNAIQFPSGLQIQLIDPAPIADLTAARLAVGVKIWTIEIIHFIDYYKHLLNPKLPSTYHLRKKQTYSAYVSRQQQ